MKKLRVGILFGGKSTEHEVSLQSARNVIAALDQSRFEPVLIGIDKTGRWIMGSGTQSLLHSQDDRLPKLNQAGASPVVLVPDGQGCLIPTDSGDSRQIAVDVVFPVLHGTYGEDGTVQGLLKLAGVPFVGAGVLGSAVGIDKDVMKRLLREAGLPVAQCVILHLGRKVPEYNDVIRKIGSPVFVKPANAGSSVGISKVKSEKEFHQAVTDAFAYDSKVLVEEAIAGREIECAVLGNENPMASLPGEIIPQHEFYSYAAKYIDDNGAVLRVPADLPQDTIENVQALAIRAFQTLCCEGMGRVDFFLKSSGELLINEINTIPGFTKISMYPKMWEASGLSYTELVTRLIDLALERFTNEKKLKTSYLEEKP